MERAHVEHIGDIIYRSFQDVCESDIGIKVITNVAVIILDFSGLGDNRIKCSPAMGGL